MLQPEMELAVFNNIMHSQNRLKSLIIYMHNLVTHKMIFCKIKIMISGKIKCCSPVMYNNLSKNKNKAKQPKLVSSSQPETKNIPASVQVLFSPSSSAAIHASLSSTVVVFSIASTWKMEKKPKKKEASA